jgi:hypothetical protein
MKKVIDWFKEFWFVWFFLLLFYVILRISGYDLKIVKSLENVEDVSEHPQGAEHPSPGNSGLPPGSAADDL